MKSKLDWFLYCSWIISWKTSFLYPTVIEIFTIPSSNNLSIILKIAGFPLIGISPEGISPKIFAYSLLILPALKISTLRSFIIIIYVSNFFRSFGVPKGSNSSAISISNFLFDLSSIL